MFLFENLWNTIFSGKNFNNEEGVAETSLGNEAADTKVAKTKNKKLKEVALVPPPEKPIEVKIPGPDKYAGDIAALQEHFDFTAGSTIELTLHQILDLCPRKRRRLEPYIGLKNELKKKYDINLVITSKNKKL